MIQLATLPDQYREESIAERKSFLRPREREFISVMHGAIRANSSREISEFLAQNQDLVNKKFQYHGKEMTVLDIAKAEQKPDLIDAINRSKSKLRHKPARSTSTSKLSA